MRGKRFKLQTERQRDRQETDRQTKFNLGNKGLTQQHGAWMFHEKPSSEPTVDYDLSLSPWRMGQDLINRGFPTM